MNKNSVHDIEYLNLVDDVLRRGVYKPNRTGMGTYSIFAREMRFNLRDGTIPLLTTKKMHTRGIFHEIIWYLSGDTNIKYLKDNNVSIWDEWASPDGQLNKIYGFQWRRWENPNWKEEVVEIKLVNDGTDAPFVPPKNDIISPEQGTDNLLGKSFTNNRGDQFVVIRKVMSTGKKNSEYEVQFTHTTSIVRATRPNIRRGQVDDPYAITVWGQGCIGSITEKYPHRKSAYNLWYNMMRRCYDPTLLEYQLYGAKGVFVDQSWRCFSNFIRDIHNIVGFAAWKNAPGQYVLDKDYFGGKSYGPKSTIFLPVSYNQSLPNLDGSKIVAVNKHTKKQYEFTVQRWFAKAHNIKHSQNISTALLHSPTSSTRDWTFRRVQPREGHAFRQKIYVDQISNLINMLRTDPNSRRLLVSAWNVGELDQMALPPCHYSFQFYAHPLTLVERYKRNGPLVAIETLIENGGNLESLDQETETFVHQILDDRQIPRYELSMLLNQRSCDVGLGVPFNIAQYSTLLRMVAQVVNMATGEFIWRGGDVHIYENHVEALKEQLTRTPYESPYLLLDPSVKEIDDFKFEHFNVVGYQYHPAIKMDVAV